LSESGSQPMLDETTGNVIVFNGEIYNHPEIRRELVSLGIAFRGQSDTETILRGYGAWGTNLFPRLRGMFAFAIYRANSRSVTFCRDRLGIKPLYLARAKDGSLAFASEVRPLLSLAGKSLSKAGLAAYLHWGACPHQRLLFENIEEFPSGCWAEVAPGDHCVRPRRYWPMQAEAPLLQTDSTKGSSGDPVALVRSLLEDAVRCHLLSDVPVACFLSGGIDSSILVALAARQMGGGKLATFSVGFTESGFDESKFARQMAGQYGTNHHHIHLTESDKLAFIQAGVSAMDLPSTDALNTYIVSDYVAGAGYKVVLSGLGADELFGGYPIFRDFWRIRGIAGIPSPLRNLAMLAGKGRHVLSDVPDEKSGEALSCWWRRIWSGPMLKRYGLPVPEYVSEPSPGLCDSMAELSWGEMSHYMRDMLLRDSDGMSMAHSLEIRVPFLDNELIGSVLNMPARLKFDPKVPKRLLLAAVDGVIPEEIWNRPKMGFSLPMQSWMLGPLRDYCQHGLDQVVEEGIFNKAQAGEIWSIFESRRINWAAAWSVVALGNYLAGIK